MPGEDKPMRKENYVIGFAGNMFLSPTWVATSHRPAAQQFKTEGKARERLESVRKLMALPANADIWYAHHMHEAQILAPGKYYRE